MATINGKSFNEVFEELKRPFPMECFKKSFGNWYLPKPYVKERIDQVIGLANYDFISEEPQFINGSNFELGPNNECAGTYVNNVQQVVVRCSIIIYDDNRNVVLRRTIPAAAKLIYKNGTMYPNNLSNDIEIACGDAFKRCAKWLGIGEVQIAELNDKDKQKKNYSKNNNGGNYNSRPNNESSYTVAVASKFSTNSKGGITAKCSMNGESHTLVIWKDAQEQIIQKHPNFQNINDFMLRCKPGTNLTFKGYSNDYNGNMQIIMTSI